MAFCFEPLSIPDVICVKPDIYRDSRGFFAETYKHSVFAAHGIAEVFVQDNHSFSSRGVLRGLHFQVPPYVQGKLVRCPVGEILDIAVDLKTGQWVSAVLNAENQHQLYVPAGFAHGFLVRSETAHVLYKTTAEYSPAHEQGIRWDDPDLAIDWQLEGLEPVVSEKDARWPTFVRC